MLVEYKGKWFNPTSVESIRVHLSGNSVIYKSVYTRQLRISITASGQSLPSIPIGIYCDNGEIDKCRSQEYMDKLASKDLEELANFINKHCKGK